MNTASSLDPIDAAIVSRGPIQNITPLAVAGSNSAISSGVQRYTRSTLYLLRNDGRSRRWPDISLRTDLMALGVWKVNGGNSSYPQNGNGNETGVGGTGGTTGNNSSSSSSNLNSSVSHVSARGRRSPSTRSNLSVSENLSVTQYGSHSHPNQKSYIDHRTISSAHLMPAFAKRRFGVPTQIASNSFTTSSTAGVRPETPSDVAQPVKDLLYQTRTRGKEHERQRVDDQQPSAAYLSPKQKSLSDYQRDRPERNEGNNSGAASPAALTSLGNNRHSLGSSANERRIGSGRLLHCDVNWDYRNTEKDNRNTSAADKETLSSHHQQPQRTSARFSERERTTYGERRPFDRRSNDVENRDKIDSRNHTASNTGGSRRYISNDNESNLNTIQATEQHPTRSRRSHYNERNDEPEWFSGGPTSQHDTIELRGFDEPEEQFDSLNKSSRRKLSESSSSRASSSLNISNSKSKESQIAKELQSNEEYEDNSDNSNVVSTKKTATISTKTAPTDIIEQITEISDKNDNNKNDREKFDENLKTNEKSDDTKNELKTKNFQFGMSEFNFDAFLNMDPLTHSLMGAEVKTDEDQEIMSSSRFSRWFVNKNSQSDAANKTPTKILSDEKVANDASDIKSSDTEVMSQSPVPFESQNVKQTNTLLQFLQRNRLPPPALSEGSQPHVGSIPSVEELEARMRKIRSATEQTANAEKSEAIFNEQSIRDIIKFPEQFSSSTSQASTAVSLTPQDTEAFKRLLEQLGSASVLDMQQQQQQSQLSVGLKQQNQEQQQQLGLNANSSSTMLQHEIGQKMLPSLHISKCEDINKFIHQQQFKQQQQQQRLIQQNTLQQPQNEALYSTLPTFISQDSEKTRIDGFNIQQGIPSPRDIQFHTQNIMQNALLKKKLEEQENFRRRQELQKHQTLPNTIMPGTQHPLEMELIQKTLQQHQLQAPSGLSMRQSVCQSPKTLQTSPQQQQQQQPNQTHHSHPIQQQQHQQRHINSPTPLAFTPTSVLRKMTADKDNSASSANTQHQQAANQLQTSTTLPLQRQQSQSHHQMGKKNLQSVLLNQQLMQTHQQQSQVINPNMGPQQPQAAQQPRMILGGGNHPQQQQQQVQLGISGQQLTHQQHSLQQQQQQQQKQQQQQQQHAPAIHTSQQAQRLRNNQQQMKWQPPPLLGQIASQHKPIGRPILKGPVQSQQQKQQIPPMTFASKLEFQQVQQQQKLKINPALQHIQQQQQQQQSFALAQQQQPPTQQNIITHVQQHLFQQQQQQQQRAAALQRAQQIQLHQLHQQQQHLNRTIGLIGTNQPQSSIGGNTTTGNTSGIINYQRDGGLSPTSNQLAQWFSPELLAQASAGKLPLLNMNQALSLEEFERSIQHSSTAVHN